MSGNAKKRKNGKKRVKHGDDAGGSVDSGIDIYSDSDGSENSDSDNSSSDENVKPATSRKSKSMWATLKKSMVGGAKKHKKQKKGKKCLKRGDDAMESVGRSSDRDSDNESSEASDSDGSDSDNTKKRFVKMKKESKSMWVTLKKSMVGNAKKRKRGKKRGDDCLLYTSPSPRD